MHFTAIDDAAWASPWRRRHVGEKVFCSLALIVTVISVPTWPGSFLVAAFAVALLLGWARIPARALALAAAVPVTFLLGSAFATAISIGRSAADAWWVWGPFSISPASLALAGRVLARGIAGTLGVLVLAMTTPIVDLLAWGRKLRIPEPLLEIASLTYALIFGLVDKTVRMYETMANRLGTAPLGQERRQRWWDNQAALLGNAGLRAWQQSQRLNDGLELRGFESSLITLAPAATLSLPFTITISLAVAGIVGLSLWIG